MAEKKLMLLHLNDEEMEKQAEALFLIQKLTKPQTLGMNAFITEDEIIAKHIQSLQKKYLDFLKETESQYKAKIKELNQQRQRGT